MTAEIAGLAAFLAAGAVYLAARLIHRPGTRTEEPSTQLRHLRLVNGATCFACRIKPAVPEGSGLWCAECKERIHEIDNNDVRGIEEK